MVRRFGRLVNVADWSARGCEAELVRPRVDGSAYGRAFRRGADDQRPDRYERLVLTTELQAPLPFSPQSGRQRPLEFTQCCSDDKHYQGRYVSNGL
jgi:hypothetical protein